MPDRRDTRERLLDVAQELAQTRGLNAFSFRDLADAVGIRTASVHHHFRTKDELARELMARYRASFLADLRRIDAESPAARRRLERFAHLFLETLRQGNRLCLCGRLAADFATLPAAAQDEVRSFYRDTETWLAMTLEGGARTGELQLLGAADEVARTFLAALEGAMVAARAFDDERRLVGAGSWLIDAVTRSAAVRFAADDPPQGGRAAG